MRRRLRNYWKNTDWTTRFQGFAGLAFMIFVLSLDLMRRFIPAWLLGLFLSKVFPATRWRLFGLALLCVGDTFVMEWVRGDWPVYLSVGWIFLCLGYFLGAHFLNLSQEPADEASQAAEPAESA